MAMDGAAQHATLDDLTGSVRSARMAGAGPALPMLAFRAVCLAAETGCIALAGSLVQRWHPALHPAAMALAYAAAVLLLRGWVAPPSRAKLPRAAQALLVLSTAAVTLQPAPLAAVPVVGAWCAASLAAVAALRTLALRAAARLPGLRPKARPVAFIGNSESAARMLRQLQADPFRRAQVVGFFDDRFSRPGPLHGLIPCLGHVDELVSYIHNYELHDVYMALPWSAGERISTLIDRLRFLPLTVRLVPDQAPPALRGDGTDQLEGVVMPTLMRPPFSAVGAALKRGCDLAVSLMLLVPLSVLFLLVAAVIKLDSRGPVFFRQSRSGHYGRPFQIYKFRSLHVAQADQAAETLVLRGDKRVTRIGRTLRKYSIDELPQILNVALGDMSLVGPRPHAPRAKADGRIYAEVMPDYMLRYRVKPGMTGWAQVNGWRGNTDTAESLRKRVEFDFEYIRNWSLAKDFLILLRTIPSVISPPPENA